MINQHHFSTVQQCVVPKGILGQQACCAFGLSLIHDSVWTKPTPVSAHLLIHSNPSKQETTTTSKHPETSDTSSPLLSWDIAYSLAYYLLSTPTRSVTSTVSPASSGPTAPRIGGGDVVTGRRRVAGGVQDGFMIHWHPGILQVQQSSLSHQVQDWFS